ncbi:hypothetical protein Agub_g152, partial [Astrephomene gubernaculifera]
MRCNLHHRWPLQGRPPSLAFTHLVKRRLLFTCTHRSCNSGSGNNRNRFAPSAYTATDGVSNWTTGEEIGPAFKATLDMLEWPKLCEHVARFASTHAGKRACRTLSVPDDAAETLHLLEQTRAMTLLEYEWATPLDYGGIQSGEAEAGLARAAKGALMSSQQLRAVVSLVAGGERLRRQLIAAAREHDALRAEGPLRPLLAAAGRLVAQPQLVRAVAAAVDEDSNVQDSASEPLRQARARVKALRSRLEGLLKGHGGEVSERGGR